MFFVDTKTGEKLSHFNIRRPDEEGVPSTVANPIYCSAHVGNTVHTDQANLLVNAWYTGGADVIDFNDRRNPFEATFYDSGSGAAGGSDNWTAYWYEGPGLPEPSLTMYGNDGVEHPPSGEGFQVFSALTDVADSPLPYLNPQTQEQVLGDGVSGLRRKKAKRFHSAAPDRAKAGRSTRAGRRAARSLAP